MLPIGLYLNSSQGNFPFSMCDGLTWSTHIDILNTYLIQHAGGDEADRSDDSMLPILTLIKMKGRSNGSNK